MSLGSDAGIDSVKDIHAAALRCLRTADIELKLKLASALPAQFDAMLVTGDGAVDAIADDSVSVTPRVIEDACIAGRPERPNLVLPSTLPKRGLGSRDGRAAFIHAIAHIEFNAINLACDAVYRFRGLPLRFYRDWLSVAADEAKHFGLLQGRLADFDHAYGDFDAHNGLWEMAEKTAHSCLERMALVPRVLEARGLDVTPGMIERLQREGDGETVAILDIILREEVAHVAAGTRWYHWCCDAEGINPVSHFRQLLARFAPNALRGPLNEEARQRAGFTAEELAPLEPAV